MLYLSILTNAAFLGCGVNCRQSFSLTKRKTVLKRSAATTDKTYPVTPILSTAKNRMLRPITSEVFIMPCTAKSAVSPTALTN